MTIAEFFADPKRTQLYRDWLGRPDTGALMDLCRANFVPMGLPPGQRTGEQALYYAGCIDTAAAVLGFLTSMDGVVKLQRHIEQVNALTSDYGRDEILALELGGANNKTAQKETSK